MIDDDFLLDENDEYDDGLSSIGIDPEEEESDELLPSTKYNAEAYKGKMSSLELDLIKMYDEVLKSADVKEACSTILSAIPHHTSSNTVGNLIKEIFHLQGHHRMVNTLNLDDGAYRGLLSSEDIASVLGEEDDDSFNEQYAKEAQELITRFIDYLANRDLSGDSINSIRKKKRQIPAFIIFLFQAGMYDLILDCPTLPEYYQKQVKQAFNKINEEKRTVVEDLAKAYEAAGRTNVAERVRELGTAWFDHEPAEIKTNARYKDLKITAEDVDIYRLYRSRFTNISKSLTLEVVSELIEVAIDPEKGIYERLKDKTRTDAIDEVKDEYRKFVEREDPSKSEIARKVIFNTLRED